MSAGPLHFLADETTSVHADICQGFGEAYAARAQSPPARATGHGAEERVTMCAKASRGDSYVARWSALATCDGWNRTNRPVDGLLLNAGRRAERESCGAYEKRQATLFLSGA